MSNRLYSFLEKYKILNEYQYGFRKNRSTTLAIYKYVQQALNYLNEGYYSVGILLDMTKAYDRVQHKTLLQELYQCGIRGKAHEWIASYLSNRLQYVQIQNINNRTGEIVEYRSDPITVNSSIPQGSVLGCILFLIYINNLPKLINIPCVLFADDVSLLYRFKDANKSEVELKQLFIKIKDWLEKQNLLINYTKTKLIEFRPHQKSPLNVQLNIDGTPIENVSSCTLLGLEIDSHLNWKNHIERIKAKLSRFTYALFNLKLNTDKKTAITAYYAYAHSWLSYGIILWGNSTSVDDIFILQKKCIRIIMNIDIMDTCRPHFKKLEILTVTSLYILEICKFVKNNPDIFDASLYNRLHTPRIHNKNKYKLPSSRMAMFNASPYYSAIKIFNNLPTELRMEKNTKIFLKKLKIMLIEKCYYNLGEYFNND